MKRADLTEKILDVKREKGWTWAHIAEEIGGLSPILITAALLGQMKLPKPLAANAGELFGLSPTEQAMLNEVPYRGSIPAMPPSDPLIYRFYELVMVYGSTFKGIDPGRVRRWHHVRRSISTWRWSASRNPKGDRAEINYVRQISAL